MVSNNKACAGALLRVVVGTAIVTATVSACGGGSSTADVPPPTVQPLSAAAVAGEALFNDKSLSASGQQSCATCHVKSRAFTADPAGPGGNPTDGFDPNNPSAYNVPVQCQPKESVP